MLYTGLFKRVIPFVLTFALGLVLASLFGAALLPSFDTGREGRRARRCQDRQELLREIEHLNEELRDLKMEKLRNSSWKGEELKLTVPPVDIEPHHPPAPPKRPKNPHRSDILQ